MAGMIARVYIGLGQSDKALDWLEKGLRENTLDSSEIAADPSFDPIRSDPRFQPILKKLGLG